MKHLLSLILLTALAIPVLGQDNGEIVRQPRTPEIGRGMFGEDLMIRISHIDFDEIIDITTDGDSHYDLVIAGLETGDITFINDQADQFYLRVADPVMIDTLKYGDIEVITEQTMRFDAEFGDQAQTKSKFWGNPSVEIRGYVKECKLDGISLSFVPVRNARVDATMDGVEEVDYSRSNGYFYLYWAPGHCESRVTARAMHPRSYYSDIFRTAKLQCWGWDSDDFLELYFNEGGPCH